MRWSALRRDLQSLWVEDVNFDIHQTVYTNVSRGLPRLWATLDKEVILDFWKDYQNETPRLYPCDIRKISDILRAYIDTPVERLMEPVEGDFTGITDLLRAMDRRLGKTKLLAWKKGLHPDHPAHQILDKRFKTKVSV